MAAHLHLPLKLQRVKLYIQYSIYLYVLTPKYIEMFSFTCHIYSTALVVQWSEFMPVVAQVSGSILGATTFSE
jgi:hypothetical protein